MDHPLNLLVIEDDTADYLLVQRHLRKNGLDAFLHHVTDQAGLDAVLNDRRWHVVLSDYNVPGMEFTQTLGKLRSALPDIPLILVSGTVGEERAIELFKLGMTDFVLKDNLVRLVPAITRALHEAEELRAKRAAEQALELAIEATGLGMFDYYPQTGRLEWNSEMKRNFELQPGAEITFEIFLSRAHPEDREHVAAVMHQAMQGMSDGHFYIEHRSLGFNNGQERWVQTRGQVFFDGDGKPVRCIGTELEFTERKQAEERIRQTSLHDPLTGLPNRGWLFESAQYVFGHARRAGKNCGIVFLDLDRFKPINDNHGHAIGDKVLKEVARRLTDCIREEDIVIRLGGDEFLILVPEIEHDTKAEDVARHISRCIKRPYLVDGLELSLSTSAGISIFPRDGNDLDTLISRADAAMYQAKQMGRDNIQFFSEELAAKSRLKSRIEGQLKVALNQNTFQLHYQPLIDLQTARLIGVEALVRWPHEDVGPDQFVPVAESTGHIERLGEWVISEACRQHRSWRDHGLPAIPIAVNVSAVQLRQSDFANQMSQMLGDYGIDPLALQVEVTETALIEHLDWAIEVLTRLQSLGVQIALDDFGTGYSSLNYLSRLPINKIKIDKSFVQRIEHDTVSRAITEAVIALGRTLKLEVVAEGIESEAVLHYFRGQGCSQAQGFHICRPIPADAFETWFGTYDAASVH